jgi:hypothetical protein
MNIAILGVGNIGGAVGKKWARAEHSVIFGTRDANSAKAQALRQAFPDAKIETVAKSLEHAEVVLIAVPYAAVEATVKANAPALAGKIVIDATNKFGAPVVNNLKTILAAVPTARVYRAFNSLGWELFENPQMNGGVADHFYCGADGDTRAVVEKLIAEVGNRPIWVGGNELIGIVDAVGALWVTLVFQRGHPRGIAFKLLER